jgi:hypothetical protein
MRWIAIGALPALLMLGASCARPEPTASASDTVSRAAGREFARRLPGARGVAYAAQVAPGLYRGGAPDEAGVEWLRSIGIRTVINLRHYHGTTEGERVRAAGMRYERIPLESSDAPEPEQVARFLELVRDPTLGPTYVHCLHGVDRTGVMMAVYRLEVEGWERAEALAEMKHFGPHKIWRDLRRFVREYEPTGRRGPGPP